MKWSSFGVRGIGGCGVLAVLLGGIACDSLGPAPELYINEFMADNATGLTTDDGSTPDWIEIYNGGEKEASLDGIYISDVLAAPTMWELGLEGTLAAGDYLLLLADGETGAGHVPFRLDRGGEELGLFRFEGDEPTTLDAVTFPSQPEDQSSAREPDGGAEWVITDQPTPGESNG